MAELAIGAVSFFFQAFAGCVQGYELISDACRMRKDCQALLVNFTVEYHRMLNWANTVKINYTDEELTLNHMSRDVVMNVMQQQSKLLTSFGRLDKKYRKLSLPLLKETPEAFILSHDRLLESGSAINGTSSRVADGEEVHFPPTSSNELVKKAFEFTSKFKEVPRRLTWAIFNKEKMEGLIAKLANYNDKMNEALSQGQLESVVNMQTRTSYQILVMNRNIEALTEIIQSQMITAARRQPQITELDDDDDGFNNGTIPPQRRIETFGALAQSKAVNLAIEDSTELTSSVGNALQLLKPDETASICDIELRVSDVRPRCKGQTAPAEDSELDDSDDRTEAFYKDKMVWIEWKTAEPGAPGQDGLNPKIEDRVRKLATLLKKNSKKDSDVGGLQFRAPQCLGYFKDEEYSRFGIVFEKPDQVPSTEAPTSLYDLLKLATADEDAVIPSLTTRVDLMRLLSETVERLHAVDWLHKGLRSTNILFFTDPKTHEINFSDPYISGFDYSRPAGRDDLTERPSDDLFADFYRHPFVQRAGNKGGFRKSHDLYSLGVLLFEIAYWKPLEAIFKIDPDKARPKDAYAVRSRLLTESKWLQKVRSYQGDTVEQVIRICLEGPKVFGRPSDEVEPKDMRGSAELQRVFGELVVDRLQQMRGL
ncbi:hypothetical protein N0V91_006537 [Didymella pomorum]|uniref:Prion-inhibition and propagation HeLo domain-containing protein n=1 Tax=Didymella pomorum TaxID=749634 RepID=A0A9W9D6G1_9PLEO|nr:hypothetical protein N0V91_006537 [Didymella pomorum]